MAAALQYPLPTSPVQAQPIVLVDASGNPISSFGGGTQYTDGAAPPANPIGGAILYDNAGTWVDVGTDHGLPISVLNANPNGQTTMSASAPVAIASNQTPLVMATPTVTQIASSATSGIIFASNASRKGAILTNDSTAILYLLYGSGTASATNYTFKIPAQGLWEMPSAPIYTGAITGVWSSANGFAYVTEVV